METQTQALETIIERSMETFQSGGVILAENTQRSQRAVEIGRKIIADIEAYKQANGGKISAELDERMKMHLVNCNKAKTEMNESRKIITQTFTIIANEFTAAENNIDASKAGTPANIIQAARNAYAKQVAEEQAERERQLRIQQQKGQEAIELKAKCETNLLKHFSDYLLQRKQALNTSFNELTLADIDERSVKLKEMIFAYPYLKFKEFKHNITGSFHTFHEIDELLQPLIESTYPTFEDRYKSEMITEQQYLVDRLPSKKKELEAIAVFEKEQEELRLAQVQRDEEMKQAGEAKRKELEAQQAEQDRLNTIRKEEQQKAEDDRLQREEQERIRVQQETAKANEAAQQQIESNKAVDATMNLFTTTANGVTEAVAVPETRTGYEITVISPAGYVELFQMWFTSEGALLSDEKILSTKIESMKTFCEKKAHKDGTKIESRNLKYEVSYKAVNRRAGKA